MLLVVAGAAGWYLWQRVNNNKIQVSNSLTPSPSPFVQGIEQNIQERFRVTLPENVDKAELKDVSGGNGSAIATKKYENNRFDSTVLADLPDPADGKPYHAWLTRGTEDQDEYEVVYMGTLQIAKGGYIVDYQNTLDLSGFTQVIVSRDKTPDNKPQNILLQGSF